MEQSGTIPVLTRTEHDDVVVFDDLAGMPVSEAEIAVVEAFLLAQVQALMEGATVEEILSGSVSDSDAPQIDAGVTRPRGRQDARRGTGR